MNPDDDWEDVVHAGDFSDDYQLVCPNCGSSDFAYAGEAYDDEEYLGSSYDCIECGKRFTMDDSFED